MDHDGLKDGWWDNWGADVAAFVAKWAGRIATVCGIASLLVGWIPIVGQALAAVLGTIALVASVVSLVCNLALYLTGRGDLLNVVLDVVSVATFGLGRVAGAAAKVGYRGLRGASRLRAGTLASRPAAGQPSRQLLDDLVPAAANVSRRSARNAVNLANRHGLVPPGSAAWRSLKSAGRDVSDAVGTVRSADWGNVIRNLPRDFRTTCAGTFDDGGRAFFAKLYGDPDGVANVAGHRSLAEAIRSSPEVASHANRAVAQHVTQITSSLTGSGVDGYQAFTNIRDGIVGAPTPAEQLNVPSAR